MSVSEIQHLARVLDADERTLRRAVAVGAIRGERPGPRSFLLSTHERTYVKTHWELLSALRRALRTEPNVRLAILFGSAARGDDRSDSDVDLLVSFRSDAPRAASGLALRLEEAIERDVDVARLPTAIASQPLLLVLAIDEGRVLVDRDHEWPRLRRQRSALAHQASTIQRQRRQRIAASLTLEG